MRQNEEVLVFEPVVERSLRQLGWIFSGVLSLIIFLFAWSFSVSPAHQSAISSSGSPWIFLGGAVLIGSLVACGVGCARMALETRRWTVRHNYLQRNSEVLSWNWSKSYRATAWRLERYGYPLNIRYTLNPVSPRILPEILPFYSTRSAQQALELGRQLANVTGWPLRLSTEMQRLEKELQRGI